MAFPAGSIMRVVIGGAITSQEQWRTAQWWQFTSGAPSHDDFVNAGSDVVLSFLSAFWNRAAGTPYKSRNVAAVDVSYAAAYLYNSGVLSDESIMSPTPVPGTASSASPPYTACVFSLKTAAFGRSARGRAYLPWTSVMVATSLQMNVDQADADNFSDYLQKATITPLGPATVPVVLSQKDGVARPITSVSVDSIPDTQHGRSRKMVAAEKYTSAV